MKDICVEIIITEIKEIIEHYFKNSKIKMKIELFNESDIIENREYIVEINESHIYCKLNFENVTIDESVDEESNFINLNAASLFKTLFFYKINYHMKCDDNYLYIKFTNKWVKIDSYEKMEKLMCE